MELSQIAHILEARFLACERLKSEEITKAGASDLLSDVLAADAENALLLTGIQTIQMVKTCNIAGIGAVILIRGKVPDHDVIELAEEEGLPLLSTGLSMFIACGRLYQQGIQGLKHAR
ncbi:MAG: transcriptional regulator [Desulfarculaceae bacterium]|nr:transcriptional regulator [Desulfarculaceae bacterium]